MKHTPFQHKIVHISTVHKPYDTRIFLKECCTLARQGYQVFYLVPKDVFELKENVSLVPLPRITNPILRILLAWIPAFIKALKLKADVYHFHDPELIFMGFLLSFTKARIVYDVHEDYELQILNKSYIPRFLRPMVAKLYKVFERVCLFKITSIITVTKQIAEKYNKFGKHNAIVRNYPIVTEFLAGRSSYDKKRNEVCYIGGITKIRGVFDYVRALEHLPEVRLNLGGDYSHHETELKTLPGWKNVNKYGFVNRTQINEILSKSKLGLVVLHAKPNYLEALPVKMFEYMAAGVPVICSNFPTYEEIIIKYDCGVSVQPNNPTALAEKINNLLKDEESWKRMSKNAINAVENLFSWEKEAKILLITYETILKSKQPS